MPKPRWMLPLVVSLVLVGGIGPVAGYWYLVGRAPTVTAEEARRLLADPGADAMLIDVRTRDEFATGHLDDAVSWPMERIEQLRADMPLPATLAGKRLLLICNAGWNSARAVILLRRLSFDNVYSVHGGLQEWRITASPQLAPPMVMPRYAQWGAVISGFVMKPIYMLGALALVVVLWRRSEADLAALRWAMVCFFFGEAFCLANYIVFGERSYLFEYLHSFGMVLTFACTCYATMEALDLRLIHYSDPAGKCAAVALCRGCIKHADVACGLRRVFLVAIPATLIVAALPLFAAFRTTAYTTRIFGTTYAYIHEITHQVYEIRLLPVLAMLLLAASFAALLRERHPAALSKVLYAAALGAMGFSFFRLVLVAPFHDDQVWFGFWEETTELLYVLGVAALLLIFRRGVFATAEQG